MVSKFSYLSELGRTSGRTNCLFLWNLAVKYWGEAHRKWSILDILVELGAKSWGKSTGNVKCDRKQQKRCQDPSFIATRLAFFSNILISPAYGFTSRCSDNLLLTIASHFSLCSAAVPHQQARLELHPCPTLQARGVISPLSRWQHDLDSALYVINPRFGNPENKKQILTRSYFPKNISLAAVSWHPSTATHGSTTATQGTLLCTGQTHWERAQVLDSFIW